MPYMKCRVCDTLSHLRVTDPEAWAKSNPGPQPATGGCFMCWGNLAVGQRVKVRSLSDSTRAVSPKVAIGDVGTVLEVRKTTPDGLGDEYRVEQIDSPPRWAHVMTRSELQRVLGKREPLREDLRNVKMVPELAGSDLEGPAFGARSKG